MSDTGFVYIARVKGVVKVGHTVNVERRMRQIGGVLIASAPGTRSQESELVAACRAYRSRKPYTLGREWFTDGVWAVLAPAWVRMFASMEAA